MYNNIPPEALSNNSYHSLGCEDVKTVLRQPMFLHVIK